MTDTDGDDKTPVTEINEYQGYTLAPGTQIVTVDGSTISGEDFFDKFISNRQPVKVVGERLVLLDRLKLANIVSTLKWDDDEDELQVERSCDGGFGSSQERVYMTFNELVERLQRGEDDYYLTTQYEQLERHEKPFGSDTDSDTDSDSDSPSALSMNVSNIHDDFEEMINGEVKEAEAAARVEDLYQAPLTNLTDTTTLPLHPRLIPTLIPQQINLWMGRTRPTEFTVDTTRPLTHLGRQVPMHGSSSGLHHDHADNLYIQVQGHKKFTLYSPADATKLYTFGKIHKVFENGVIDYERNEAAPKWNSIRDDGAIVADVSRWKGEEVDNEEDQEIISSSSTNVVEPPSFSKVPPALLHLESMDTETKEHVKVFAEKYFPGILQLNKMEVWLEEGQMLYLPAGWFHEVSSFNGGREDVHIAVNYWFVPPNAKTFSNPYKDEYWREDWKLIEEAISLLKT
ncbi:hypothetical protein KGF56_002308 [Candida oxycetoniae]|uniref:JmjC domain-containing protein n=1 Tax=Candida oxycetoniae TaxID=497107 RepID=A0AAI9WY44_9ASCO|nr:uncharacterized protein KGF56_002308 [Candida oxycetoniae]KAI3404892.2 hypothetical protein KGF56_002308 [Candida oxycetoniae]